MPDAGKTDEVEKKAQDRGLAVRNAFLFLVDWRKPMITDRLAHSEESDTSSPMLSVVLRSIANIMKKKIIERVTDEFGVVAFGTGGAVKDDEWPRMRVIRPLERLNAAGIKRMERIADRVDAISADTEELDAQLLSKSDKLCRFGDSSPVQFDKALWAARHQLQPTVKAANERVINRLKVIVLTNDQDPTCGSSSAHKQSVTQARDLIEMNASIDVMLLTDPSTMDGTSEDISVRFFDEMVSGGDYQHSRFTYGTVSRNVSSLEDLMDKFQWRNRTKRALLRTIFTLGEHYKFGVAMYILTAKAKRPTRIQLFADTNLPVKRITTRTCEAIGKTLKEEEIRYTYNLTCLRNPRTPKAWQNPPQQLESNLFGFTAEEVKSIADIGATGITLYGFKKKSLFRIEQILRSPIFLHPDDTSFSGSKALFTQLMTSMLKKDVIAIVCMAVRKSSGPRFAALVPQEESQDENGRQEIPAGMYLYHLPYKNDVRTMWRGELKGLDVSPIETESPQGQRDAIENVPKGTGAALKIVSHLTIKNYHPRLFANIDLQKFYGGLQKEAGVRPTEDMEESMLKPKLDRMQERVGDELRSFKALTMGSEFDGKAAAQMFGTKTGRRALMATENESAKRVKREHDIASARAALNVETYIDLYRRNMLNSMKKNEFAQYLRAHGEEFLPNARKRVLLQHVVQHLKNKYSSRLHGLVQKTL